jgi:hypothetical protein
MPITLTERHTLKFLDGIQIKGDDGFMISALPGKWHPFEEGNFFTVRLTGVERESHPTDIPPYVTENLLPSPERFSDKLIKKTNRHAVLVIARNVSAPAYIPRELMAVQDDSMNLGSSCIDGIVEMLICDSKPISPTTPYLWYISTRPIVLIDYKFPLVADERNERVWNKKIGEDYPRMNINYTDSDPDLVIYDHGLYKPKRQRFNNPLSNNNLYYFDKHISFFLVGSLPSKSMAHSTTTSKERTAIAPLHTPTLLTATKRSSTMKEGLCLMDC